MAITRTIWKNQFKVNNIPSWICPVCKIGKLIGDKKSIQIIESVGSKKAKAHDDWDPEWISGGFSGTLSCNNHHCGEVVQVIGKMDVQMEYENYEDDRGAGVSYSEFLSPVGFVPAIHIFSIHVDVPKEIENAIIESFKVYWIDIASCGNKIRTVVELIMDEQKITKTYLDAGKRRENRLHKRIELFKKIKPEEADLLMAIKWIGNSGSHKNEVLTKDDILDAYEILDHVVTKLYEKDSDRLKKLSKAINKRRKPIGGKRLKKRK